MAGGGCQGRMAGRIPGPGPDVPLLPKQPLYQGFHGPWAKQAGIWAWISSGLLLSLQSKGLSSNPAGEQALMWKWEEWLLAPHHVFQSCMCPSWSPGLFLQRASLGTQSVSTGEGGEKAKAGQALAHLVLSNRKQPTAKPTRAAGWALWGAKRVSLDHRRGADQVPEDQWLVQGAQGVPAAQGEHTRPQGCPQATRSRNTSLSHSRNALFLKLELAVIYLYKAEPHLPGHSKALLCSKAWRMPPHPHSQLWGISLPEGRQFIPETEMQSGLKARLRSLLGWRRAL